MAKCYETKFHVNHHQGERMYKVFGLLGLEVSRGAVQEWIQSSTTPDPGNQLESDKL